MLVHPQFDPIAFSIGPLAVRWYGLMYLVGFAMFMLLGMLRARQAWRGMSKRDVEDMLFYGVIGVIVGGRLGFVLFYQPAHYLAHPLDIFKVWQGGMAAHGGVIGVIAAIAWFARTRQRPFLQVADFVAPLVPLGLMAGRLGNFINGELWGRVTDPATWPWAMVFPQAGDGLPRHPSQIYQAGLEGLLLFIVLWIYSAKPRPQGTVGALFVLGYGVARFLVEFAREPDAYLPLKLGLSQGQWLSLPMIAFGAVLFVVCWRRDRGRSTARS